jgi:hypothetical protein
MLKHIISGSVILLCLTTSIVVAGELADFEADIKSGGVSNKQHCHECNDRHRENDHVQNHNDRSEGIAELFFDVLFDSTIDIMANLIAEGGEASISRVEDGHRYQGIKKRRTGEPLLPFVKLNLSTQYISEWIGATDLRFEVGKGPLAFEARMTRYRDESIDEKLDYDQIQALYRMSVGHKYGINLGLGYGRMQGGNEYDGLILSMPLLYYNGNRFGYEFRPVIFNAGESTVSELDISVLYAYKKMAFRLGYRTLDSPNETIDGMYMGLDLIF